VWNGGPGETPLSNSTELEQARSTPDTADGLHFTDIFTVTPRGPQRNTTTATDNNVSPRQSQPHHQQQPQQEEEEDEQQQPADHHCSPDLFLAR